jgi:pheromone shutdown protein TraB
MYKNDYENKDYARYEYEQRIAATEAQQDDVQAEQREVLQTCVGFETAMMQAFHERLRIEANIVSRSVNRDTFSENEQEKKYIANVLLQQEEEITYMYGRIKERLEDEREALQRERDELTWD